jgi:hypothetical protein
VSALVDGAIDAAGLSSILEARHAGTLAHADLERLRAADLLALGALADRVRAEEVGDEVLIDTRGEGAARSKRADRGLDENETRQPEGHTDGAVREGDGCADGYAPLPVTVLPPDGSDLTGLDLLREVAVARITGPRGSRIRIDWSRCGLELAQVALGFGASELAGPIADKRGLPLADGAKLGVVGKASRLESAQAVKRRELEGFVRRAGRTPRFDGAATATPPEPPIEERILEEEA